MQPLQSLALAFECRQSRSAACSSFLHARAVLYVAVIACDRTAVNAASASDCSATAAAVSGAALTALECECERLQLLHFNRR